MFRLPRLLSNTAIADNAGRPSAPFIVWWQTVVTQIEKAVNAIVTLTGITDDFATAITNAQNAANTANTAAATANAAAATAAAAAAAAAKESALNNSYISPDSVLTTTTTVITVAAHTRHYGDGTSVSVSGGTVAATGTGDLDYVYYSDPTRAGGTVTYICSTTEPAQTGDTHVVGAATIPTSGTGVGGGGPKRPGYVVPDGL
jgi:hypothetical protein